MVVVHRQQAMDPRVALKLRFWFALVEKETAGSYLCQVSLVLIGRLHLLYCIVVASSQMAGCPNNRKPSFAQSLLLRKAVDELI